MSQEASDVIFIQEEENAYETLEEPVWKTIWRDVKRVGTKLWHVLIPRGKSDSSLRDWDLWGPLIFCLMLALLITNFATEIFVIVWIGAFVITANSQLLGGKVSFFQSVCILGYCIFPLVVAAVVLFIVTTFWNHLLLRFGVVGFCFVWATFASVGFLTGMVPQERRILAVYPVMLFYMVISWMVIVHYSEKNLKD